VTVGSFAEVWRNPSGQFVRTGTDIPTFAEPDRIPVRSYSTPAAPFGPPWSNVMTVTESGECRVHRSLYVKTPHALSLNPLRLLAGEQRIRDVSVLVEDGVVESWRHPSMIRDAPIVGLLEQREERAG
jgi:hypothetical protein